MSIPFHSAAEAWLITSIILLIYTWIVYPLLLFVLKWKFSRPLASTESARLPYVSIIVAAHNEGEQIAAKLDDCLRLEYPSELLEIIVASDGSTDSTNMTVEAYAERDPRIRLLSLERAGKSHAQNAAARTARGEILVFTDVNTRAQPHLLKLFSNDFQDLRVGIVTATVHFVQPNGAVPRSQGLYWSYELFLRQAESAIGVLATGSGQALAVRKSLFRPVPSFYGDDCILPLDIRLRGYRVVQDAQAIVFDTMPNSIRGELRARVRMTARNWTGTLSRVAILNPIRFPVTAWALISHKFLRWLTPLFLLILLFSNTLLLFKSQFASLWVLQVAFYAAALVGWLRTRSALRAGWFGYPFAFCLANVGFFLGLLTVLRNEKITAYQRSG